MPQPNDPLPIVEDAADLEKSTFDRQAYWRANISLIFVLLSIWAIVSYGFSILLIDWLNQFSLGNLPLGFWFAQQGSIYVFVALIFVYAILMDRIDKKHGVNE